MSLTNLADEPTTHLLTGDCGHEAEDLTLLPNKMVVCPSCAARYQEGEVIESEDHEPVR